MPSVQTIPSVDGCEQNFHTLRPCAGQGQLLEIFMHNFSHCAKDVRRCQGRAFAEHHVHRHHILNFPMRTTHLIHPVKARLTHFSAKAQTNCSSYLREYAFQEVRRYSRLNETGAAREAIRIYPESINHGWEGAPYAVVRGGEDSSSSSRSSTRSTAPTTSSAPASTPRVTPTVVA